MKRRDLITLVVGGAAAWPLGARAQPATTPVLGYLHLGSAAAFTRFLAAFKAGLREGGFVEGENVEIEYRWAEGYSDRLPAMAAELVRRGVSIIATGGAEQPVFAAQAATKSIPVVFVVGVDPVKIGIVSSMARPVGNVTGIAMLATSLESKRFGLLLELIPRAKTIAVLVDPSRAVADAQIDEVRTAAAQVNANLVIVQASKEIDLNAAFALMVAQGADALQVCANPFFLAQRQQMVALTMQYRLPTVFEWRDFAQAGGLMSYGTDLADSYRHSGVYVARILKGAKPGDLPVVQPTKFELIINAQTAKTLGLTVPSSLLTRADEVIE